MICKRIIATAALAATVPLLVPAAPALADGAASTRNILLGIGAATYLVIQHNRKVHERYAEDARRQAELQSENNDAWAAYSSEKRAYANESAEVSDLKREVAYQHRIIEEQRSKLSMNPNRGFAPAARVAYAAQPQHRQHSRRNAGRRRASAPRTGDVAMISYGWGQL